MGFFAKLFGKNKDVEPDATDESPMGEVAEPESPTTIEEPVDTSSDMSGDVDVDVDVDMD